MSIALLVGSLFFLAAFVIFSTFAYQKREREKYNFSNHFCFEILPDKSHPTFIPHVAFGFIFLACYVANFIYFSITSFGAMNVAIAFVSLITAFSIGVIFYLPLTKLKERCIFSIVLIVLNALINALLIYQETFFIKAYENNLIYLAIVVNAILLVLSVIAIFLPNLFDFSTDKTEDGINIQKKVYPLALVEWILIFAVPLSQISIIIMEFIKK